MIELVIEERRRSIGPFEVWRVLPFAKRRMVGPFIFLDHMGPVELPKGVSRDTDVRPHPPDARRQANGPIGDLDSQQRARLADIAERTPVTLTLKRGARITTTLT